MDITIKDLKKLQAQGHSLKSAIEALEDADQTVINGKVKDFILPDNGPEQHKLAHKLRRLGFDIGLHDGLILQAVRLSPPTA